MKLNSADLANKALWEEKGYNLPSQKMINKI